ncbi:MAG: HAD family hydrolase [Coriobacteriales bacterium]|nr:HAD family hydrolase [Coriobacteriales bacterium]
MQKIDTVFFDAGNTLLRPAADEAQTFARLAAAMGAQVNLETVSSHIPTMYLLYDRLHSNDESFWQNDRRLRAIWLEMYNHLGELTDVPAKLRMQIAERAYEHYFSAQAWQPFDDTLPALQALQKRGVRMGIISNWESTLKGIISGLGLSSYFDCIISSAEVGLHKPMPEVFELALTSLDARPEQSLHIGDTISADIHGARAVGITPVLIDRENQHAQADSLRIEDLRHLLNIIGD